MGKASCTVTIEVPTRRSPDAIIAQQQKALARQAQRAEKQQQRAERVQVWFERQVDFQVSHTDGSEIGTVAVVSSPMEETSGSAESSPALRQTAPVYWNASLCPSFDYTVTVKIELEPEPEPEPEAKTEAGDGRHEFEEWVVV